jgi:hypothetical protein
MARGSTEEEKMKHLKRLGLATVAGTALTAFVVSYASATELTSPAGTPKGHLNPRMDEVFKTLGDPTRRELLDRLVAEDRQSLGALEEGCRCLASE